MGGFARRRAQTTAGPAELSRVATCCRGIAGKRIAPFQLVAGGSRSKTSIVLHVITSGQHRCPPVHLFVLLEQVYDNSRCHVDITTPAVTKQAA